jgi:thiol-disulfide isomerase/thioredoxin
MIGIYFLYLKNNKRNHIKLGNKRDELIFYWAEWCGICKKIKPTWNNSKKIIKQKYPNLEIKEIDCDDPEKCFFIKNNKRDIIEGVPTIVLRRPGNDDIEYEKDENNKIICNKEVDDIDRFLNLYLNK